MGGVNLCDLPDGAGPSLWRFQTLYRPRCLLLQAQDRPRSAHSIVPARSEIHPRCDLPLSCRTSSAAVRRFSRNTRRRLLPITYQPQPSSTPAKTETSRAAFNYNKNPLDRINSIGSLAPFLKLHRWHNSCMLAMSFVPPFFNAIMWSL